MGVQRKILRHVKSSFHMVTDSGVQELDLNGTGREKMLGQDSALWTT